MLQYTITPKATIEKAYERLESGAVRNRATGVQYNLHVEMMPFLSETERHLDVYGDPITADREDAVASWITCLPPFGLFDQGEDDGLTAEEMAALPETVVDRVYICRIAPLGVATKALPSKL